MEDFVSFELAVKLKEKGFSERTFGAYKPPVKLVLLPLNYSLKNWNKEENMYSAPTIHQVLAWLRKEKKLHVVCPYYEGLNGFYFYVQEFGFGGRYNYLDKDGSVFKSYEEAALSGIEHVIDELI